MCPCPHCLVPKANLEKPGILWQARVFMTKDILKAQKLIYNSVIGISGAAVERLLRAMSSVPTMVSF
jgi:hypothetical protein